MTEMKIRDEEIETLGRNLINLSAQIESRLSKLIKSLLLVCQYGISDGDFHNNLELYISVLESLRYSVLSWSYECNYKIIQFLEQLDQVDGYLYF